MENGIKFGPWPVGNHVKIAKLQPFWQAAAAAALLLTIHITVAENKASA